MDMNFNVNSTIQLQRFLYEHLELKPLKEKNDKGNHSVAEEVLLHHADKDDVAFCKMLLGVRKLRKAKNTYVKGMRRLISETDNQFHTDYWLNTVKTYRSCIAKGTMIEVVRDISKHPNGIPIEDVKVGDYVYCFDDNLNPTIKKVLWSGKTGYKEVIRIHWKAGHGKTGYLDCTPEHKIRLVSGQYVEAQNLIGDLRGNKQSKHCPKIATLSMRRVKDKLFFTGIPGKHGKGLFEHRFIYKKVIDKLLRNQEVVHHKDENHYNHLPENLVKLSIKEHKKIHSLNFTKQQVLRKFAKARGRIKFTGHHHINFKPYLKKYGIDYKICRTRYNDYGDYFSKGRIIKILTSSQSIRAALKNERLDYARFSKLVKQYEIDQKSVRKNAKINNHTIIKVEWIGKKTSVYDLEIEDVQNFIANEICVHNSATLVHTIPKHGDIIEGIPWAVIRKVFTRRELYERVKCGDVELDLQNGLIGEVDYVGAEVKVAAAEADDDQLIDDLNNGFDQHSHWAGVLFGINKDVNEIKKLHGEERFLAKNNFTFANLFGAGNTSIAEEMRKHEFYLNFIKTKFEIARQAKGFNTTWSQFFIDYSNEHIQDCQQVFYNRYKGVKEWQDWVVNKYYDVGYVENKFGFRRRYPMKRNEIINFPIQSTSFHLLLHSLIEIDKQFKELELRSNLVAQVHDSGFFNIHFDEAEIVMDIVEREMTQKPFDWIKKINLESEWEISDSSWHNLKLDNKPFKAVHIKSGQEFNYRIMHWFTRDFGFSNDLVSKVLAGKKDKNDKPYKLNGWELRYL